MARAGVAAVAVLLTCAGCGAGGGTVARVGGEAITGSALDHWVTVENDVNGGGTDRRAVLRRLIALHWISAEGGELGLSVSGSAARKQLALLAYARRTGPPLQLFADEAELQRLLNSTKLTAADRIWLVSVQMLALQVHQRLIEQAERMMPRGRLAAFYRAHPKSFIAPETRDMEIFMTNDRATAARGRREVEAGKNFEAVAKRLNVSPEAHGGLIMGLARGAGEPQFEQHVFHAPPHVLLGPVTQVLTYVYRVTRIVRAHRRPLAQVQASIRHELAVQDASGTLMQALTQRWRGRTKCRAGYVVAGCREYASAA